MKRYSDILTCLTVALTMAAAVLLSGCQDTIETEKYFTLQFAIPAESEMSTQQHVAAAFPDSESFRTQADQTDSQYMPSDTETPLKKVMGDPGTEEKLAPPRYAYVFVVFKRKDADVYEVKSVLGLDVYRDRESAYDTEYNANEWSATVWDKDFAEGEDRIYHCKITALLRSPVLSVLEYCHVYAAMSPVPLTLKDKNGAVIASESDVPDNEEDVQKITFEATDALQPKLQNIYSTPYNHIVGGKYYADLDIFREAVSEEIMLYHVASKVDLKWNVPYDEQTKLRITGIQPKYLFKGDAYLFKPTENVHAKFTSSDGYTPAALVGDVAGTWWFGRAYFYTIFYRTSDGGPFPVQTDFNIKNTNSESAGYNNTYTYQETFSMTPSDNVFVPWVRGQLTFPTAPVANKTETQNLDE